MKKNEALELLVELKNNKIDLKIKAKEFKVTIIKNNKLNKGWAGIVIDRLLGGGDNKQKADHSWAEIKSFPVKKKRNGVIVAKETMQITMIEKNLENLEEDFYKSHVYEKMNKMIVIARKYGHNFKQDSSGSQYIHDFFQFDLTGSILKKLETDYKNIINFMKKNKNNKSKRFNGELIQSRTKGQGGTSRKSYGFYALPKFLNKFLN